MSATLSEKSEKLIWWYENAVKPFLAKHAKERISALDNDCDRLKRISSDPNELTVCFIGTSSVGKSTLLNAIAAGERTILPAGGIGPLTAQATVVLYSDMPKFKVVYHSSGILWRVVFALEKRLEKEKRDAGDLKDFGPDDLAEHLLDDERKEVIDIATKVLEEDGETNSSAMDNYLKQGRLIVTGNQFGSESLAYIVDGLRIAGGKDPKWGQSFNSDDLDRIKRVAKIYSDNKSNLTYQRVEGEDRHAFRVDLEDHAAGFLAPLIKQIEVGWPSDFLKRGIALVDLPGVGVANDSYRDVTRGFVRDKAKAIIVVADRSGLTESTIELLKTSGYWDRLVGSADDPESDPCAMLVAVTKVDDVSQSAWSDLVSTEDMPRPKKYEVFLEKIEEFKPRMRAQFADQLGKMSASDNLDVQRARDQVKNTLLSNLQVFPLSAPEYKKVLRDDEEDRSFLRSPDQSGVPALMDSLIALSEADSSKRFTQFTLVVERFAENLHNELEIIQGKWAEVDRATEEVVRLQKSLDLFLAPRRKEYDLRRGSFREFLDQTVPEKIEKLVLEASQSASNDVNEYLNSLRYAHWATLRAAVVHGGTYYGTSRYINLPDDIATYFQEPMAAVWGQKLLKDIRKRTTELTEDLIQIVTEIFKWANENGGPNLNKRLLNAQHERVLAHAEQMKIVGKEAVDELRNTVKTKLLETIRKPIKKACEKFVEDGDARGPGVKNRILELFEKLAADATKDAKSPATKILKKNYDEVREEITKSFNQWGDPLEEVVNIIISKHEKKIKESDTAMRQEVIKDLEQLKASAPDFI
jgi:GTP-binding protein EngB required for normal cell division